jgi:thymidylate synthase (FAD)
VTVTLLAYTTLADEAVALLAPHEDTAAPDHLHEVAGRVCYRSFDRPNPKTAANADYLANVIRQGHESVLAHSSFTFYVTGVSRSLSHEFIRSRWWSFSEVSQRYVNMEESDTVIPPAFRDEAGVKYDIAEHHRQSIDLYNALVETAIRDKGLGRKQAREAARCVLPGGTSTDLVVSANCRAIRDFLRQRWNEHADREIREFAGEVLAIVKTHAPNTFQDIADDPAC